MTFKIATQDDLKQWMQQGDVCIIDVREEMEHAAGRFPHAHLRPLGTLKLADIPRHDHKKLVLHCGSGGRSARGCQKLLDENPNLEVYNLEGGIKGWIAAGYPVETPAAVKSRMPLEQQVQLTIGIILVSSMLLSVFVNANFLWIPFLVGCGLIFAALSGFCGLLFLIAKMPWNKTLSCSVKK